MAPSTKLASSLYSGIFDEDAEKDSVKSAGPVETSDDVVLDDQVTNDGNTSQQPIKEAESSATAETSSTKPQAPAWSAALRFAPRKNIVQQKKRPTVSAALLASSSSIVDAAHTQTPAAQVEKREDAARSEAGPSSTSMTTSKSTSGPSRETLKGIKTAALSLPDDASSRRDFSSLPIITEPPELNIPAEELERDRIFFAEAAELRGEKKKSEWEDADEDDDGDVNGWGNTKEGKKAKKKKYKRKRGASPGLQSTISMDADYDVRVPNDYGLFKELMRSRKEAVRRIRKEKEMQEEWDSDDENDDEEDEAVEEERRRKMSRFAPPASYQIREAPAFPRNEPFDDDDEKPYLSPPPPPQPPPPEATLGAAGGLSAAENSGQKPQSGEEAYQRRLALSQAATGEDAYQRRLAMSQQQQAQSHSQEQQQMHRWSPQEQEREPSSGSAQAAPENLPDADEVKRKREAAIAIAARLAKLRDEQATDLATDAGATSAAFETALNAAAEEPVPGPPPPGPPPGPPPPRPSAPPPAPQVRTHVDPSTFAERLLAKQGWKKGESLGSDGNRGILEPIRAEKLASSSSSKKATSASPGSSHRQDNGHATQSKASNNRGRVVNSMAEEERRKAEAQYGPPSEVLVLENVVGSLDELDDDLPQEIGDECGKHGFVQRVLIHPSWRTYGTVPPQEHEKEDVKIFVRFSGMAGAWRCLKELDGRYFGGRTVRARFYDCRAFDSGDYSRPIP